MLLVHTSGSVKIGEIVRYTITYTPSLDRILPLPEYLHLRIKNTASLPLRAAYLHGPYTAYVSVRRQEFHPYKTWESEIEGDELEVPQYEPNLKAGASFYTLLRVPDKLRDGALKLVAREENGSGGRRSLDLSVDLSMKNRTDGNPSPVVENEKKSAEPKSVTWIIEVISQTIFSAKATVGFELLLGRDEKSLGYGLGFGSSSFPSFKSPAPNNFEKSANENDTGTGGGGGENKTLGVLSPSVKLKVQDTADLWNLPPFPSWDDEKSESRFPEDEGSKGQEAPDPDELDERENRRKQDEAARRRKRVTKKVHLVIITHGLHSNTGADMLFMKEAIDDEARRQEEAYQEKKKNKKQEG